MHVYRGCPARAFFSGERSPIMVGQPLSFWGDMLTTEGYRKKFWERVIVVDADRCWEWMGYKNPKGYGQFGFFGKRTMAPRVCWMLTNGKIPDGLHVLHKCDNPSCVNPSHLWLGSIADNNNDSLKKGRRTIPHLYGENHGSAKLTNQDVLMIRELRGKGIEAKCLSLLYGVSDTHIRRIVRRANWKLLTD